MPTIKEQICRNPKCGTKSTVYIENVEASGALVFYVFTCPGCGKEVPFSGSSLEKVPTMPANAISAKLLSY